MSAKISKPTKDTIYIDPEDDISMIIDKVRGSDAKLLALVLPKRSTTLKSIINLKLLKLNASQAGKNIVLITSEAGLLPIVGAAGLFVAKSLQAKPAIPASPGISTAEDEVSSITIHDSTDSQDTSLNHMVGQVATEETIELDNEAKKSATTSKKSDKKVFNKKLKIPNFNKFRFMFFGGIVLLILLIAGGVFALVVLPKANIIIKTDTSNINIDMQITASADAKQVDIDNKTLPGVTKQLKKTDKLKTTATGQRDDGTKATGTITITNCNADNSSGVTLPAGTILTTSSASGNLAYSTNESVYIPQSDAVLGTGACKNNQFKNVSVTAQSPGGQFNISANKSFTTATSGVTGKNGSDMSGGTSNMVQVVGQSDIDSAKQKITDKLNSIATGELKDQFVTDNSLALSDTFNGGAPVVSSSPNVNETGTEVTVTVTITYTELGVKKDDLKQLVENEINKSIDSSKQVIQDSGMLQASIQILDKSSANKATFELKALAIAGPQLDKEGIKTQIAGKKSVETRNIIQSRPGIKDVTIKYSPFWVFSTPKNVKHINITFDQNNGK